MESKRSRLNMIWLGAFLALAFWLLDALMHVKHLPEKTYLDVLVSSTPRDLWLRSLIAALLLGFGIHAQATLTKRKRAEVLSARLGRILDDSWNEIYVFDVATLHFLQVNEGARRNLGYNSEELVQMTPLDIKPEYNEKSFNALIDPLRTGSQEQVLFETVHRRKDGTLYPVEVRLQGSRLETPPVFVAIIQDITERKQHITELERLALYDRLTSLPNRTLFQDRLSHAIELAKRENSTLITVVIDLNRLREIYNTLGPDNGDLVLQQTGKRLQSLLRKCDTVARLESDEFALALPKAGAEHASTIAGKVHTVLEPPFMLEGKAIDVGASVGVALFPDHGNDPRTLIQRADVAMRQAKHEKSNFAVYDAGKDPYSLRRLTLFRDLHTAINNNELKLHFQPKLDLKSQRITGVEALARWEHPVDGSISPGEFIPLAEQTGLIKSLTEWVLKEAVRQCQVWNKTGLDITVAVNLSTRNLQAPLLSDQVAELLSSENVAPENIILEITESAIMDNPERAYELLIRLNDMGIMLSIDDFGTGYSSLAYLKRLPVDELKIDQSFVKGMTTDENDIVIVRSTIDLAHNLGLKVTAEGVEDKATLDLLAELGCDRIQGFHLGYPLPAIGFDSWLSGSQWRPG